MNKSLGKLIVVQFKDFFREPEALFWSFFFPIILSWILGIAFSGESKTIYSVGVVGDMRAAAAHFDAGRLAANGLRLHSMDPDGAATAIKRGKISLYLQSDGRSVTYLYDPRSPEGRTAHLLLEDSRPRPPGTPENRSVALTLPGTRYIDFLIPGLLAMDLMQTCMWGLGWGLIEIRMKKFLRRMVATPMGRATFLFSHVIGRYLLAVIDFFILFAFAYFYFHVRIQGSLLALFLVFTCGYFAFAGLAILISSRTANNQVGNGLINAATFPMMLMSGVFFSYHHFPAWAIPLVQKLPLTMVADSLRAVFIEGAGPMQVLPASLALAAMGLVFFFVARRIYRWY